MATAYTLRAGPSTGRIDTDDLGEFRIRDGQVKCDDYDTASALVARYSYLEWPDGDPGADDDEAAPDADSDVADAGDGADADADAEADSDDETPADDDDADAAADEVDLEALSYSDLQSLAKDHDIAANQATEDLIAALRDAGVGAA